MKRSNKHSYLKKKKKKKKTQKKKHKKMSVKNAIKSDKK